MSASPTSNPSTDFLNTEEPTAEEKRGAYQRALLRHMQEAAAIPELQRVGNKPFKVTTASGTTIERR
jgi:hypothetical protein